MFKKIKSNFFMPLASSSRFVYWDCLNLLFNRIGTNFSVERNILTDELKEYFEKPLSADLIDSDDDEEFKGESPTNKASHILRNLQNYGWIEFEVDRNYIQHVNFTESAIKIYNTILEIESDEQVEYSGTVLRIYSQVKLAPEKNNPDILLENIYNDTRQLITELQTLNANIKHYIEELTKKKTVQELLDFLMNDYVENIVNKAYHRLITSDNISKVRPEIIEILKRRSRSKRYINLVSAALSERKEIDIEEAEELTKNYLFYVITQFQNIDEILDEINIKNRNYINSAINRTKFLMSDTEDVKGQLKEILSTLNRQINEKNMDDRGIYEVEYLDSLIQIYSHLFPDENSLYQPPTEKIRFNPSVLQPETEDRQERLQKQANIFKNFSKALNPEKINRYVLKYLADKESIHVSELPLSNIDDFVKVIYTQLYGNRKYLDYYIDYSNSKRIEINGFRFEDFVIRRNHSGYSKRSQRE